MLTCEAHVLSFVTGQHYSTICFLKNIYFYQSNQQVLQVGLIDRPDQGPRNSLNNEWCAKLLTKLWAFEDRDLALKDRQSLYSDYMEPVVWENPIQIIVYTY